MSVCVQPGRWRSPMSLEELLRVQDQPVSEEQAWALCFQLCALLIDQTAATGWRVVSSAAESVCLNVDGSVSLRDCDGIGRSGDAFLIKTEEQALDFVARLVYLSLDWGLESQVERELSETLEILLCRMSRIENLHSPRPVFAIKDVIQVCKGRLCDPETATEYYRSVCSRMFLHFVQLSRCLQVLHLNRQKLLESEAWLVPQISTDRVSLWGDLVEELSQGVTLRPMHLRTTPGKLPAAPSSEPPYSRLLQDIEGRRYTLRRVQCFTDGERKKDLHQTILEFIRSLPKLRPASERQLKLKPRQQKSLHELLMEEIRSTNTNRLARRKRPSNTSTGSYTDHVFSDGTANCYNVLRVCGGKRRCRSVTSRQDLIKTVQSHSRASGLSTITDVKKMDFQSYQNWRVCSCCATRSLYFNWHNLCSLCHRVVCPSCCVELFVPWKHCVNLPLSFFRQMEMKDEESQRSFWRQRWAWDTTWVPLVVLSCSLRSAPWLSRSMRDWHSQEICLHCKDELLARIKSFSCQKPPASVSNEI